MQKKEYFLTHKQWNKGLTKDTNDIMKQISKKCTGRKHTDETKKKISLTSKEHWKNEEYRTIVIKNATIGIKKAWVEGRMKSKRFDTKPELAVESILKKLNIKYIKQYPMWASYPFIHKYVRFYDFYLPEYKKIIEVNGDYWHGNPNKYKNEDLNLMQQQTQYNDGLKFINAINRNIEVYYIWENETKNGDILYEKISEILCATYKLAIG